MKKLIAIILTTFLAVCSCALVGCGDQMPHTHSFSSENEFYCAGCNNYVVDTDQEFEIALHKTDFKINIIVTADVKVDVNAWANIAFGGENTTEINIKGENDSTITFNQLNNDWNNVNIVNENAVLSLENVNITNAGRNDGPWNRHDINFNVAVKLNNVVSDKALAFKNSATLNNVVINENNGDCYAIWIQPNHENQMILINGLEINNNCIGGRGIKIDDQYIETPDVPGKVILNVSNATFKTNKKAAIIVKSSTGAQITLANINILDVDADKVNAVWVDADASEYAELVTVTGGTKIVES